MFSCLDQCVTIINNKNNTLNTSTDIISVVTLGPSGCGMQGCGVQFSICANISYKLRLESDTMMDSEFNPRAI